MAPPCRPLHSWADGVLGGTPDGRPARPDWPPLPTWSVRLLLGQLAGLWEYHQTTLATPPLLPAHKGHQRPCGTTSQPSQWVCVSLSLGDLSGPLSSSSGPRGEDPPEPPRSHVAGAFSGWPYGPVTDVVTKPLHTPLAQCWCGFWATPTRPTDSGVVLSNTPVLYLPHAPEVRSPPTFESHLKLHNSTADLQNPSRMAGVGASLRCTAFGHLSAIWPTSVTLGSVSTAQRSRPNPTPRRQHRKRPLSGQRDTHSAEWR